jgi:transcriptional regulator with XRE-family HTH domain
LSTTFNQKGEQKMKNLLQTPGIQSKLARKSGIARSTITSIFSGKRRATVEQAAVLAPLLRSYGVAVSCWELVSCPKGTKLMDLVHEL